MKPKFTDKVRYPHGYKPSHSTDIRKTFERIREQQKLNAQEAAAKVKPIIKAKQTA